MRRTLSLAVLVTLISLVPASTANAGGNWLEFREDSRADTSRRDPAGADRNLGTWAVLHVGQHVVAATGVYAPEPRQRRLEREAPFYAWLVPEGSFGGGTRVPETAIRLAPFELRWISKRSAAVRARFTVPAVPSGKYEVIVCNEPCTYSGFGEYVEGWVTVMQTPDEARLLAVARARNGRARVLSRKVKNLQVEVVALDAELASVGAELRERTLHARAISSTIAALEADRTSSPEGGPLVPGWALLVLAVSLVAAAVIARRRRSSMFVVPDTVPDDLVEGERVGVELFAAKTSS